eukprot:942361_1
MDLLTTWTIVTILIINLIESQDICLWNAYESAYVNGLYKKGGNSQSGNPSYSISIASDCIQQQGGQLFIYKQILTNRWTISAAFDSTNPLYMEGNCSLQQADTTLLECSKNWQIPAGTAQASVTSTTASSCPQVKCDALQLSFPVDVTDGCIGNFQIKESNPNVYQKGTSGIYLYFNPSIFKWVCGYDGKTPNKCHSSYISQAEAPGWNADTLNSNGKTINVPWNNDMSATITCIAQSSSDGIELSKGAIIGISIGGGCCCLICCCSFVLFYLANN